MHLLFLIPTSPLPITSGGHQRVYQVIRRLAARHHVTVLSFWRTEEGRRGLAQLAGEIDIQVVPVPFARLGRKRRLLPAFARLVSAEWRGLPLDIPIWEQPGMHKALREVLDSRPVDLMQVEYPYLAPYALACPDVPNLLMAYEVFGVLLGQMSEMAPSRWARIRQRRRAAAWDAYERSIYPRFGGVGAVSEADAALIQERSPSARTFLLPNGVDTVTCTPGVIRPAARNLIFVGSLNHGPNVDAACWFLDAVWPGVRRERPDLRLTLVNLDSPPVRKRLQPGVEVTGRVPDLAPLYRQADIAIVPLLAGTGSRLKLLEAFAFGLPVVSTHYGFGGVAVSVGEHLLQAESAVEFQAAILSLLDDPAARSRLATNGRRLVVERYDWEAIASLHEAAYDAILTGVRRS